VVYSQGTVVPAERIIEAAGFKVGSAARLGSASPLARALAPAMRRQPGAPGAGGAACCQPPAASATLRCTAAGGRGGGA
jgi:hypothetical protein